MNWINVNVSLVQNNWAISLRAYYWLNKKKTTEKLVLINQTTSHA